MGGVAGQEDPAGRVPLGDALGGVPRRLPGDLDVQSGCADGPADVFHAALVGEVLQRLAPVGVPRRVEDPPLPVVDGQQGPVRVRLGEVAHDEAPVADHVSEHPGPEGDAHVVEEVAGTALADPELFAHGAARAVGGDQVVGAHRAVLAALAVLDDRGDPALVLFEGEQFGGEPQVRPECGGDGHQHRLDVVLAAQAPGRRAETGQRAARVDLFEQPLLVVAGQGSALQDAVVVRQDRGGLTDPVLDVGDAEQFHGADVDTASTRVQRGSRMLLDQHVRDAMTAEEQRGAQAHQRAAHDEDRDAVVDVFLHGSSMPSAAGVPSLVHPLGSLLSRRRGYRTTIGSGGAAPWRPSGLEGV